jgi:hypothetical protein
MFKIQNALSNALSNTLSNALLLAFYVLGIQRNKTALQ